MLWSLAQPNDGPASSYPQSKHPRLSQDALQDRAYLKGNIGAGANDENGVQLGLNVADTISKAVGTAGSVRHGRERSRGRGADGAERDLKREVGLGVSERVGRLGDGVGDGVGLGLEVLQLGGGLAGEQLGLDDDVLRDLDDLGRRDGGWRGGGRGRGGDARGDDAQEVADDGADPCADAVCVACNLADDGVDLVGSLRGKRLVWLLSSKRSSARGLNLHPLLLFRRSW